MSLSSKLTFELNEYLRVTPLKRIGEPDDIGPAAVFLAADAGKFMTGETIVIDGGATMHK